MTCRRGRRWRSGCTASSASCGAAITAAGEPLLHRAQHAGVARPDAIVIDVARMVGAISVIRTTDPEQIKRILGLALDGLRAQPR